MVDGGSGVDEGDEVLTLMHHVDLMDALLLIEQGLLDLQNDVGALVQLGNVSDHLSTGRGVVSVGKESTGTGVVLDEDFKAVVLHLLDSFGSGGNAALTVHNFSGNTDHHKIQILS